MKKIFAAALVVIMSVTAFTACKNNDSKKDGDAAEKPASGGNATEAPLPAATITILFEGSNVTDDKAVVEAANARLKELGTNITVKPIWGTWGDFETTANNALQTGDASIDIVFTCSWAVFYDKYAKTGNWVRLDDPSNNRLEKYGKEMKAAVPQALWNAFTVSGTSGVGIYAVPGYKEYAQLYTWDINNTRLAELGFDFDSFNWSWETFFDPQFEAAMAKAKEVYGGNFYPLNVEAELFAREICSTDAESSALLYLGFDPANPALPSDPVVTGRYDTEIYERFLYKIREYYLAGYIDPRLANADQAADVKTANRDSGEYLFGSENYAPGYDKTASTARGIDARFPAMSAAIISTSSAQGSGYGVSTYSKHKDQAVQFLNLWYTDKKLATILCYGIEGTDYTTNADGTITQNPDRAFKTWRNGMGNITVLPPTDEEGVDHSAVFKAYNNGGKATAYAGFSFDATAVENQLAALASVMKEFVPTLNMGAVDPAMVLPQFRDKLKANGLQTVIDEYNKQFQNFKNSK